MNVSPIRKPALWLASFLILVFSAAAASWCAAEEAKPDILARARAANHPLAPALHAAYDGLQHMERNVHDYSCTLIRRERVDGQLSTHQYIAAKVRHRRVENGAIAAPFSVYLKFRGPARLKGREVLYVEGQNAGQLLARRGGRRFGYLTASLDPTSELAMKDNRYPITDFGMKNLVGKLIEVGQQDINYGECEVGFFKGARLNDRTCTHIRVVHPQRREHFRCHQVDIFIDDELNLPVYYAAYDWPLTPGDAPKLLEEYTYVDIRLNVGYTDADFAKQTYEFP